MAKTKPNVGVESKTPELVLGRVLFARTEAEKIVAVLNEISTHVITTGSLLDEENLQEALSQLDEITVGLHNKIKALK